MSAIHPALTEAFPPSFARFGETLGPPCEEATPLPVLLGTTQFAQITTRYTASFHGADTRSVLSMWSQHYLLALIPCAIAAMLAARQDLPVAMCGMSAVLTGDGQPCRLCVPDGGHATAESCPVRRMTPLLRTHLQPLAAALATAGLSELIFWSNAAAVLAWSLGVVAAPEADRAALSAAMSAPCWADGGPNPFRLVIGSNPAERRICCLRFRLGSLGRCPDCPAGRGARSTEPLPPL